MWFLIFVGICVLDVWKCRLVNAATGTGKTMVYLAPVVNHLLSFDKKISRSDGTFGMVRFFEEYVKL